MKMELRRKAIDKIYKRRDRIDMPDFQREPVWPAQKKRKLIDSILKGWHLPKFYFRITDENAFDCVDGQQRLTAIFEFFSGQLQLDQETSRDHGGATYHRLSDGLSDRFDDFEIEVEEISDATDEELEELFQRLQLGTPLNAAERLNAIQGDMRTFCQDCAAAAFMAKHVGLRNTRYTHFEIIVRWAFIESRGVQPQMRFEQLESLLKDNRRFSEHSETARLMKKALGFLGRAFTDGAPFIRTRSNLLSILMLGGRCAALGLTTAEHAAEFGSFAHKFYEDLAEEVERGTKSADSELQRYQQAITAGSTGGDSLRTRFEVLSNRLVRHSPAFSNLLSGQVGAADEPERQLSEIARRIRDKLSQVNTSYSARHGHDLFKLTGKTTDAIGALDRPRRTSESFGSFVDDLYFLIYEGSGECKRLPAPPPQFSMDVKFLRVELRHDLDHGPPGDAAKKRLRNADVFKKYSGKKTPGECSQDEIFAAQLRIMDAMEAFLDELRWDVAT